MVTKIKNIVDDYGINSLPKKDKNIYIYGESFIKTKNNLYGILSYNVCFSNEIKHTFYVKTNSLLSRKGKTNCITFFDGNNHVSELKDNPCFNQIKEGSLLYKALLNRISFKI